MDLVWKTTWVLGVMFRPIHRRACPHFVSSCVKASISTSSSLPAPIPSAVNQASELFLQNTTDEMTASHSHPTLPSLSSTQLRAAHHVPQPGYGGQSYVFFYSGFQDTTLIFAIEKEHSILPTLLIFANISAPTASPLLAPSPTKHKKRDV